MASIRSAVNPKVYSVPSPTGLPLVKMRATDSKTWVKGELCSIASAAGTVEPFSGAGTQVYGIFAEDQSTSTSSSDVYVLRLLTGTMLEMYVTSNGTDATIGTANIGTAYDVYTSSNVTYLDTNSVTGGQFFGSEDM